MDSKTKVIRSIQEEQVSLVQPDQQAPKQFQSEQELVTGVMALTPNQHWFFDQNFPDYYFTTGTLFEVSEQIKLNGDMIKKALQQLLIHHDALRARFVQHGAEWTQFIPAPDDNIPFLSVDLSAIPAQEQLLAMKHACKKAESSINLSDGPLLRTILFDLGPDAPHYFFLMIHHLVTDGFSNSIIMQDFVTAYQQLSQGKPVQLPAKTTSLKDWSGQLREYSHSPAIMQDLPRWQMQPGESLLTIPTTKDPNPVYIFESAYRISGKLDVEPTRILLQKVLKKYDMQLTEIMLTVMAEAIGLAKGGDRSLYVDILRHGRDIPLPNIDLSRTVGWTVIHQPLMLRLEGASSFEDALLRVREEYRRSLGGGVGYDLLRYMSADDEIRKTLRPRPVVAFSHEASISSTSTDVPLLIRPMPKVVKDEMNSEISWPYFLELRTMISDNQLHWIWNSGESVYPYSVVEQLSQNFADILKGLTWQEKQIPKDIPSSPAQPINPAQVSSQMAATQLMRNLSPEKQALLAQRLREKHELNQSQNAGRFKPRSAGDNIFPLSFAQQRLWFLDQLTPGNTAYNMFSAVRLRGELNITALEYAFNQITQRHESLRTTFQVINEQPCQVIAPTLQVAIPLIDFSTLSQPEQEAEAQRLARQEAQRPFNLSSGPLVRCTLVRLDENQHILLFAMHHIISDGWSMGVLFREIILLSQAYSNGGDISLPALPIQYADFAIWQREWLQGEVLETQLSYWKKQLAAISILELPTDRPRPLVQTNRGAENIFTCSAELTQALQTISRSEGVSLFTTLLTTFQILLSRYSGQTDITVGSPHANRNRVEIEGLIGYFVNTLVLRTDLSGNPGFHDALQRTKDVVSGAHGHQDLPFERLVDELKIERDLSRNPLFQVMFIFQNTPRVMVNMKELTLETFKRTNENAQFDLTLSIMDTDDGLQGVFTYNADLFEAETIARMSRHFQALLRGIVANPDQPLSDLPMLAADERQIVLREWNATQTAYPQDKCLHKLFEDQVQRTPDAVAVVFAPNTLGVSEQSLTYRELNQRANQLARALRKRGVGPDTLVAVCIERSLEMVIGLLGILKAGGAYIPFDTSYPSERLAYMLADSGAALLLSQQDLLSLLPQHQANTICMDRDWEIIARESTAPVDAFITPDNLAYVIYTSGSTGKPKGTMISHSAIVNHMCWMQATFPISEIDSVLQKTPFSFDASVWEFYAPLLVGARLIMARPAGHQDSVYLCNEIIKQNITTLQLVPSLLRVLLSEPKFKDCQSLQRVFCGGEALPADLVENFFASLPAELINLYGPTEATIDATSYVCQRKSTQRMIPIGRPIANTLAYVLDQNLSPVPVGIAGELYISGAGLARGYLRRPQLTAEKFIPNPFSDEPGACMYRTGDWARWLPDGNIEYLGRMDHQVKLRGLRIELGEIEDALSEHPDVYHAVVIVREDIPDHKQLTAHMVLHQNATVTPNELLDFLRTRLPYYMLPAIFSFLDHMPLTPNGKLDRKALAALQTQQSSAREYIAPRTQEELHLAKIWQEILRVKQIGIHDNFFELGGDSLMVMRVIAKSHEVGLHFTPQDFFRHQMISTLLDHQAKTWSSAPNSASIGSVPIIPTSRIVYADSAPQAFWRILEMLLEVPRILVPAQLEVIVQHLISHHDALRLRLAKEKTEYRMFIEPSDDKVFETKDLSNLSQSAQDEFIAAAIDEYWTSMNLSTGPLVRFVFFELGQQRLPRILVLLHHFAADGYSVQILLDDFQTACARALTGEAIKFPAKTTSIKEWAERTYAYVQSDAVQDELAYWKSLPWEKLQPPPLDHPEVTMSSYAQELGALSKEETQALLSWVSVGRIDLLDVLLTACFATFSRHIQFQPLSISVLHQNRNSTFEGIDLSRSVGGIYTSYPFILDTEEDLSSWTPDMLLQLVTEQKAHIPNGGSTFQWISYYYDEPSINWRDNRKIAKHVTFNYLGQVKPPNTQPDSQIFRQIGTRTEEDATKLYEVASIIPHTCTPSIEEDQLKLRWIYFAGLHEKSTIIKYVQEYLDVLRLLISNIP